MSSMLQQEFGSQRKRQRERKKSFQTPNFFLKFRPPMSSEKEHISADTSDDSGDEIELPEPDTPTFMSVIHDAISNPTIATFNHQGLSQRIQFHSYLLVVSSFTYLHRSSRVCRHAVLHTWMPRRTPSIAKIVQSSLPRT
jgi:hypothetical protein